MARMLVVAQGYRQGEVVAVKSDDHVWGRLEGQPDFVQVNISNLILPEVIRTRLGLLVHPVMVRNATTGKLDFLARRRFRFRPATMAGWISGGQWQVTLDESSLRNILSRCRDDGTIQRNATATELEAAIAKLAAGDEVI